MKQIVLVTWLTALTAGIVAIFWYSEWKYQLPTPVPENYVAVATGTKIGRPKEISNTKTIRNTEEIRNTAKDKRPFFIHFFNPDCPCSKFNVPQFRKLVNEHKNEMDFMIVVLNNEKYSADQIRKKFDLDVPVSFDTSLATTCGVYSTPQAVLVDENSNLYYRGNYNKTRYCTDKKTSYAAMAIDAVLAKKHSVNFDKSALTAYGCQLPTCTK